MIKLYLLLYFFIQNIKKISLDIKIISYIVLGIFSPILLVFSDSLTLTWLKEPLSAQILIVSVLVSSAIYYLYKLVRNEKNNIQISYVETLFLILICLGSAPLKILLFLLLTSFRYLQYQDDKFELNLRLVFMLLYSLLLFSPMDIFTLKIVFYIFLTLELLFINKRFDKLCFVTLSSAVFTLLMINGYLLYITIFVLVLWLNWNKLAKDEQNIIKSKLRLANSLVFLKNYSLYRNIHLSQELRLIPSFVGLSFFDRTISLVSRDKKWLKFLVPDYVFLIIFCLFIVCSVGVLWEVI